MLADVFSNSRDIIMYLTIPPKKIMAILDLV